MVKPSGLIAFKKLPRDPDAGNPLHAYGEVHRARLGGYWTVPAQVEVDLLLRHLAGKPVTQKARLVSVLSAKARGVELPPIELGVFPDGNAWIVDGNHRLVAAMRSGARTITARFTFIEPAARGRSSGAVDSGERETWYHMTDRAKFRLDPNFTPADNAFALEDRSGVKGIYLAPNIERWVNGQGYLRPFLVELTADAALKKAPGVHGRYHGEMFVPAAAFDRLRIERVIPIDAFAREQYGSYGWIEDAAREEFDTGRAIPPRAAHYPFHGYRYTGPDVREMDAATVARLKKAWRKALKLRG